MASLSPTIPAEKPDAGQRRTTRGAAEPGSRGRRRSAANGRSRALRAELRRVRDELARLRAAG